VDCAGTGAALRGLGATADGGPLLVLAPRAWETPALHFDTLPSALLTMLLMLLGSGWSSTFTALHTRPAALAGAAGAAQEWTGPAMVPLIVLYAFVTVPPPPPPPPLLHARPAGGAA
jgi:hypothetical protein